jgi:hypothetical protein
VFSNPTAPTISFLGLTGESTPRAQPTTQPTVQFSLDHLREPTVTKWISFLILIYPANSTEKRRNTRCSAVTSRADAIEVLGREMSRSLSSIQDWDKNPGKDFVLM